jgi:metal-responsive CopG/Arc/MetJ family transcriptional regulator
MIGVITMRTVQMTLDDILVTELDAIAKAEKTNRSAFTRDALRCAINRYHEKKLLEQHRQGYQRHPVTEDEFSLWEDEQAWDK